MSHVVSIAADLVSQTAAGLLVGVAVDMGARRLVQTAENTPLEPLAPWASLTLTSAGIYAAYAACAYANPDPALGGLFLIASYIVTQRTFGGILFEQQALLEDLMGQPDKE